MATEIVCTYRTYAIPSWRLLLHRQVSFPAPQWCSRRCFSIKKLDCVRKRTSYQFLIINIALYIRHIILRTINSILSRELALRKFRQKMHTIKSNNYIMIDLLFVVSLIYCIASRRALTRFFLIRSWYLNMICWRVSTVVCDQVSNASAHDATAASISAWVALGTRVITSLVALSWQMNTQW